MRSDTTGPSLILMFYFLARYPDHAERVFAEISKVGDVSDIATLAALLVLNGFINETMRLAPAALTMGTRITPPEGLQIDGTWIPGGVKIAGPRYTIFRSTSADPVFVAWCGVKPILLMHATLRSDKCLRGPHVLRSRTMVQPARNGS